MSDDAIPAATLIVVRERADGPPELLMVERAQDMAFAGGAWVFPGGRIDQADERFAASSIWQTAQRASPRSAKPSRKPRSPSASRHCPASLIAEELQQQLLDEGGLRTRCSSAAWPDPRA